MLASINNINNAWSDFLQTEAKQPYMHALDDFLQQELTKNTIFPPRESWLNAFKLTDFTNLKVVIVGQDPYFNLGQAMGLSFSIPDACPITPTLLNINKELIRAGLRQESAPQLKDLTSWAHQGVFLINVALTVVAGKAGSHLNKEYKQFTKNLLHYINHNKKGVVFLAWGKFAQNCCKEVDKERHLVLKTSHPSPLGVYRAGADYSAFAGSNCFVDTDNYLQAQGEEPVIW